MEMKIYLTNLGKYNEGELVGKWFTLPIDDIEEALEEIGVSEHTEYEEFFISDYENDLGFKIEEYSSLEELNRLAYVAGRDIDELYSDIVEYFGLEDDTIYDMDSLDDVLHEMKPSQAINLAHFGTYNPSHDYFKFNGYGNIETLSDWDVEELKRATVRDNIVQYVEENY